MVEWEARITWCDPIMSTHLSMRLRLLTGPTGITVSTLKLSNPKLTFHYTLRRLVFDHDNWCVREGICSYFVLEKYGSKYHTSAASAVIIVRIRDQNSRLQGSNGKSHSLWEDKSTQSILPLTSCCLSVLYWRQKSYHQWTVFNSPYSLCRQMVHISQHNSRNILLEK